MSDLRVGPSPALRGTGLLGIGLLAAGFVVLSLVLVLAGGAPRPAPPGIPDAGPVAGWLQAVVPLLVSVAGVATVGFSLLAGGYLEREVRPDLQESMCRLVVLSARAWLVFAVLGAAAIAVELREESAAWASDGAVAALAGSVEVRVLVAQAALAAGVEAVATSDALRRLALPLAVTAWLPTVLDGHVRTADSPVLLAALLGVHVVAAALWVGGLLALGWLALSRPDAWATLLPRYSRLALACVVALALSGSLQALQHLGSAAVLLGSGYGLVVALKLVLLVALVGLGWLQRRRVLARPTAPVRTFAVLAACELTVMLVALALAAGLAQTPPPPG